MKRKTSSTLEHLSVFWTHLALHKRRCDFSGENIISLYPPDCPYPVYHRKYWHEKGEMPFEFFDFYCDTFSQVWKLFKQTPIPHNMGEGSENCEYTDDAWYSKDSYLSHNALNIKNVYYSHRNIGLTDCRYCIYSYDSEQCSELIYSFNCFNVVYVLYSHRCQDSAFLFGCEDCVDCILCWNLKHKQYCIGNRQLTKEEYEKEKARYNLKSIQVFDTLKEQFQTFIREKAWWSATHMFSNERCSGDFLTRSYDCHDCFVMDDSRNCQRGMRASYAIDSEDFVSVIDSSRVYHSVNVWEKSDNIRYCVNISESHNLEYCIFCLRCDDCFLSSGLIDKKFYILNKEYAEDEYHTMKDKIIAHMRTRGEYGKIFPSYFSPSVYDETLARLYYPLSREEQKERGYRTSNVAESRSEVYREITTLPDILTDENESEILSTIYWDPRENRTVQFIGKDIELVKKLGVSLYRGYYLQCIRENFSHMMLSTELREVTCAISGVQILTSLPSILDGRIISESEYKKL